MGMGRVGGGPPRPVPVQLGGLPPVLAGAAGAAQSLKKSSGLKVQGDSMRKLSLAPPLGSDPLEMLSQARGKTFKDKKLERSRVSRDSNRNEQLSGGGKGIPRAYKRYVEKHAKAKGTDVSQGTMMSMMKNQLAGLKETVRKHH